MIKKTKKTARTRKEGKRLTVCHKLRVQGHWGHPSWPLWSETRPSAGLRFQPPCPPTSRSLRLEQIWKCHETLHKRIVRRSTPNQTGGFTDCRCWAGSQTGPPGQPGEAASGNLYPAILHKGSWQNHKPRLRAVTTHAHTHTRSVWQFSSS